MVVYRRIGIVLLSLRERDNVTRSVTSREER
jgi:hypothetical protein